MTARKYTWNSVGVEGKTTVYKVEDGKLVTSETPGGFLDPSFSTVGAGDVYKRQACIRYLRTRCTRFG